MLGLGEDVRPVLRVEQVDVFLVEGDEHLLILLGFDVAGDADTTFVVADQEVEVVVGADWFEDVEIRADVVSAVAVGEVYVLGSDAEDEFVAVIGVLAHVLDRFRGQRVLEVGADEL